MPKTQETNLLDDSQIEFEDVKRIYQKSRLLFIIKNVLFLFLIGFLSTILVLSVIASSSKSEFAKSIQKNSLIKQISSLISSDFKKLQGEQIGRTNLLILGMGGEGHDGPLLTDTIIVLSYDYEKNEVYMTSIPRDMIVRTQDGMYKKINHLYTIGENIKKKYGLEYTKINIEDNIGITIHYAVVIDFYGFKEIVDALGGVDVYIENSFVDYRYPTENYKIKTIKFTKGHHHLNGDEALQFARSRHGIVIDGNGFEGSDFARSARQIKIISSIKDKILSFSTITNPGKISKLFTVLNKYIKTDVETWEAIRFVDILKQIDKKNVYNNVISDAPNSLLISATSTYDGAFILVPKNGNYGLIQNFFENLFKDNANKKSAQENAIIHILNGTKQNGLAYSKAQELKSHGLYVSRTDNAPTQDIETTMIYDLSNNEKPISLEKIQNKISGVRTTSLPDDLKNYFLGEKIDFIILLGNDQI